MTNETVHNLISRKISLQKKHLIFFSKYDDSPKHISNLMEGDIELRYGSDVIRLTTAISRLAINENNVKAMLIKSSS